MKRNLLIIFLIFQIPSFGQPLRWENFINYDTVIKELKTTKDIKSLVYKYDYCSVLLLDSSNLKLVKETGYQYIDEFRKNAPYLSLSDKTVGFVTDKKNIKEIFLDKNSLKKILGCVELGDNSDFDYPIYIKGNMAIFETSGPTWSNTYFGRLKDGVFQINWIEGIIE